MIFRNVGNRIAVDFAALEVDVSEREALSILAERGIRPIDVELLTLVENLAGRARWRWGSKQWEAPHYFDCSALIKWLYGQLGIWLPRRVLQQHDYCLRNGMIISLPEAIPGDLLFLSSHYRNGRRTDDDDGLGHICLVVDDQFAISATNSELGTGIVKHPIDFLASTRKVRAVGRVCRLDSITTLLTPPGLEIESSEDIKYIIAHK